MYKWSKRHATLLLYILLYIYTLISSAGDSLHWLGFFYEQFSGSTENVLKSYMKILMHKLVCYAEITLMQGNFNQSQSTRERHELLRILES